MDKLIIKGKVRLQGEVLISGAKNSAVAIIPTTVLADDICIIENLPHIEDVNSLRDILNSLDIKCEFLDEHTLKIDSRNVNKYCAIGEEVTKIRASYYLLGALLGRYKKAEIALPGGCKLGTRGIDQHIKGFEALGAKIKVEHGIIKAYAERLIGTNIYLDVVTVGATINIMLAACLAEGQTTIENVAKEPHVVDVANLLNSMGAKIKGAGTDVIKIEGVQKLHGCTYSIIPDQIEAGTYMIAAAITNGDVTVKNIIPKHMESLTAKLIEMGVEIIKEEDSIRVIADKQLKPTDVKTLPYPGFPTDLQPQVTTLLSIAEGTSVVTENLYDSRFQYINELNRMGSNIKVEGRSAIIQGTTKYSGTEVSSPDLRGGAALVLAGLVAEGQTTVSSVVYIDRGYENIEHKLNNLGANIVRVTE